MFILSDTAIMMFMTKMFMFRPECGSMTGTALKNSETHYVSGFTSGSFHAVSTVCPPAPNVDRRGSELHQFLQRPDGRLHFTKACESPPVLCSAATSMLRDFIAARAPPQPHVTCERQSVREDFLRPRFGYFTPFRGGAAAWTHLCVGSLKEKQWHLPSPSQGCVAPFHGPMWPFCRSQHTATCDVRGR